MTRTCCLLFLALLLAGSAIRPTAVAAQAAPPDPRFGIVETFVNSQAASEAGAGYTRIILRWDVIQPDGPTDWKPANVPDPLIEAELAAGREVVALVIGTPAWAVTPGWSGEISSRAVPDMDRWAAFLRGLAQQYQGRIRHWIIWNEPDVWMDGHPGKTWDGTVEDYARLLKTAYLAIKAVDPGMTVHVAGLTYFWDREHGRRRYLDRLIETIAADPDAAANNFYLDGVVYHLYFSPTQTADILAETRRTLDRYGLVGKEVWINETNAPPSEDAQEPPWSKARFRVTLEEQAAFVLQEFALAFAGGATRVEFYKLRNTADHPESIEPFGLLRGDDSRRPAFAAYQVATTYLRDFRSVRKEQRGDLLAVTFDRGSQTTTVLWTTGRAPRRVQVKTLGQEALLVDELGNTQPLRPVDGVYTLDLPGAACTQRTTCFIGGAPRLLVEPAAAGDRQALGLVATTAPAAAHKPLPKAPPSSAPATAPETPSAGRPSGRALPR